MLSIILLFSFVGLFLFFSKFFGFRINITSSMPIGIYKIDTKNKNYNKGVLVLVCLDKNIKIPSFLASGDCPNGKEVLLKEIVSVPTDNININSTGISINEKYYLTPQKSHSSNGDKLENVKINMNDSNGYIVLGTNDLINSWDSRYFGLISSANIIAVVKPWLTF